MVLDLLVKSFGNFLRNNGIRHTTSTPCHPVSNGLAEREVQIVKKGLKKITVGTIRTRLTQVLLAYRTIPQATTGLTPAEMLLDASQGLAWISSNCIQRRGLKENKNSRSSAMMPKLNLPHLTLEISSMRRILEMGRTGCLERLLSVLDQSLSMSSSMMGGRNDVIKTKSEFDPLKKEGNYLNWRTHQNRPILIQCKLVVLKKQLKLSQQLLMKQLPHLQQNKLPVQLYHKIRIPRLIFHHLLYQQRPTPGETESSSRFKPDRTDLYAYYCVGLTLSCLFVFCFYDTPFFKRGGMWYIM